MARDKNKLDLLDGLDDDDNDVVDNSTPSIRDTINNAISELSADDDETNFDSILDDEDEDEDDNKDTSKKEAKDKSKEDKPKDKKEDKKSSKKDDKQASKAKPDKNNKDVEAKDEDSSGDSDNKDDNEESDRKDSDEKLVDKSTDKSKSIPPVGWTKEAKAEWNKLPEAIKASVMKREEEVSKGFKEYGDKVKRLQNYDAMIDRHAPNSQAFGLERDQLVERTLQWFEAINHKDKDFAATQALRLLQSFGLEGQVRKMFGGQPSVAPAADTKTVSDNSNKQDSPDIVSIKNELSTIRQERTRAQTVAAQNTVEAWSKNKPHFEQVRGEMKRLVEAGIVAVPSDGILTDKILDDAYKIAVRSNDEIYQQLLQEETDKVRKDAEDKLKVERKKLEIQKSKNANVSIKTSSPANNTKREGTPSKNRSVAESIKFAIKELSN